MTEGALVQLPNVEYVAEYCLVLLSSIVCVWWLVVVAGTINAIRLGRTHFNRELKRPAHLPPVTVLKPLVGTDSKMMENLTSFFLLDYPQFELIFCMSATDDAARMVVETLQQRYPRVDAKIAFSTNTTCLNPKISNILPGYHQAAYSLVFLSDQGILAQTDTLLDAVVHMTADAAVVFQLHFVVDPVTPSFGHNVNKVFFGTFNAKGVIFLHSIGVPGAVGAGMLLRKSAVEDCGGLIVFGEYLAEDYILANMVNKKGWSVKLGQRFALQNQEFTVESLFNRIIRWKRLRQASNSILIVIDPISETIVQGLITALSAFYLFGVSPAGFFFWHILIIFIGDYFQLISLNDGVTKFNRVEYGAAWLFRELSAPYLHVRALQSRVVTWRNNSYRMSHGGRSTKLPC